MKNLTLTQIAKVCQGQLYLADSYSEYEITGAVIDSRLVKDNYLFIATCGERVDGHDFIDTAYEKGALAVLCEKPPVTPTRPYILVPNSLQALKDLATFYRQQLSIKVVGITGSVGKTSTKEFISSVLAQKYSVLKTEGNFNNEIGLPLTILKIQDFHEIAVLEMGISDFGEMHRLSEIAKPDICVITNIGQCHLENLGSREGILKAKSEIFDFMAEEGYICINGDDDLLATLQEVKGHKPLRFGMGTDNDVTATDIISHGLLGSSCSIHVAKQSFSAEIPLPGEHMVLNSLAATAVGRILELSVEQIAAGIATVKALGGRSNIIKEDKWVIIDDCYNANPVSMKAAIDLLCKADTRKVAILGDMFELGSSENDLHSNVGTYASQSDLDVLVCVGLLSKHMFDAAITNKDIICYYYETRDSLLAAIPSILKQNDTILVKASHGMGFDHIVKALQQ
ncbi:MAG: hypothetical protein K0R00_2538 [Herbinix sp.]|jgi:UDP-N-acetylmuramoyl-tripeptide--D-alanyl-D-alanine ligase|nr:hypothetical protein [Herbinix sp.]